MKGYITVIIQTHTWLRKSFFVMLKTHTWKQLCVRNIIFIMFDGIKLSAPKPVTMVKIIPSWYVCVEQCHRLHNLTAFISHYIQGSLLEMATVAGGLSLMWMLSFAQLFPLPYRKPGLLKQFVEDLHSGKLHREFHHGPDPVPTPTPTPPASVSCSVQTHSECFRSQ